MQSLSNGVGIAQYNEVGREKHYVKKDYKLQSFPSEVKLKLVSNRNQHILYTKNPRTNWKAIANRRLVFKKLASQIPLTSHICMTADLYLDEAIWRSRQATFEEPSNLWTRCHSSPDLTSVSLRLSSLIHYRDRVVFPVFDCLRDSIDPRREIVDIQLRANGYESLDVMEEQAVSTIQDGIVLAIEALSEEIISVHEIDHRGFTTPSYEIRREFYRQKGFKETGFFKLAIEQKIKDVNGLVRFFPSYPGFDPHSRPNLRRIGTGPM